MLSSAKQSFKQRAVRSRDTLLDSLRILRTDKAKKENCFKLKIWNGIIENRIRKSVRVLSVSAVAMSLRLTGSFSEPAS